ncbi:MAG: hypothetical protein ACKOW2_00735, partial [Sphingobacteriaceae bacterium]
MKKTTLLLCSLCLSFTAFAQLTPFERSANKNTTATYAEAIAYYQQLDKIYDQLKLIACGPTDIGKPL